MRMKQGGRACVGLAVVLLVAGGERPLWADTAAVLHNFGDTIGDGSAPQDALVLSGSTLYGMTSGGGTNGAGTAFKINTDGTGYTKIYDFGGTNGSNPYGSLTVSGDTLYGMTRDGGANSAGTAFKINTDGTGYTKLWDFDNTNPDNGGNPYGTFTLSGNTLYAMTAMGGSNYMGTLFKVNTDGTGFAKLLDFDGTNTGKYPYGSLTLSGNTLIGMTYGGGAANQGAVFAINTDGSGYNKLLDCDGAVTAGPFGSLTLSGNSLYGMTARGGDVGSGTMFTMDLDGNNFAIMLSFSGPNGSFPYGSLTQSGDKLYGMTSGGGTYGGGVIYVVPEPGTLALLALGSLAVRFVRRKNPRNAAV